MSMYLSLLRVRNAVAIVLTTILLITTTIKFVLPQSEVNMIN